MIRVAVLPFGKPGVISASMLGLGRALGETIAVTIILSQPSSLDTFDLSIFYGGETFASKIANNASEFSTPQKTGAYIAAGLVLFVLTFAVYAVARIVIARTAREACPWRRRPAPLRVRRTCSPRGPRAAGSGTRWRPSWSGPASWWRWCRWCGSSGP
jgi:phosphate transport system permease protein